MIKSCQLGFTLAELLIALLLLGVIATFSIPKILATQQNGQFEAIAKEVAATVSAAHQQHKLRGSLSSGTRFGDLTQYMNYAAYDTSTTIDSVQTEATATCNATWPCLRLHNGAMIRYNDMTYNGTSTTNAIWFHIDPDGRAVGTANGVGKAVSIFVYFNGRLADEGNIVAGTADSGYSYSADPTKVPSWFRW